MRLTPHFSLEELAASPMAVRHGIENDPPKDADNAIRRNLMRLAVALETVRAILGDAPILISSGYRCPDLNRLVGGAPTSAHMEGRAADWHAPKAGTPRQIAERLRFNAHRLPDGCKIIMEFGRWIHLQVAQETPPVFLEANKSGGRTVYATLAEQREAQ